MFGSRPSTAIFHFDEATIAENGYGQHCRCYKALMRHTAASNSPKDVKNGIGAELPPRFCRLSFSRLRKILQLLLGIVAIEDASCSQTAIARTPTIWIRHCSPMKGYGCPVHG